MSHRRQQRRIDKERRHLQPANEWSTPVTRPITTTAPPRVVVREATRVERLAYTRSQAARALGISPSTLRRLLPYIETIELPWGAKLIPVDELERLATERRRTARPRLEPAMRGRRPAIPPEIAKRICDERSAGRTLRQIAEHLNAEHIPTAHGGRQWWPSTVRAILAQAVAPLSRRHPLMAGPRPHELPRRTDGAVSAFPRNAAARAGDRVRRGGGPHSGS